MDNSSRFVVVVTRRYTFCGRSYAAAFAVADREAANRVVSRVFVDRAEAQADADVRDWVRACLAQPAAR